MIKSEKPGFALENRASAENYCVKTDLGGPEKKAGRTKNGSRSQSG
jgi:hypothetical protein